MPFVKGQSGNPGGRPRGTISLAQECQKYLPEVVALMAKVLRGEPVKRQVIRANGKKVIVMEPPTRAEQIDACKWFADRGCGKAATVLAGEGGVGPSEIVIRLATPLPPIAKGASVPDDVAANLPRGAFAKGAQPTQP